jgi:hypothetical protein
MDTGGKLAGQPPGRVGFCIGPVANRGEVQSPFVPESKQSATAVVVSGGKQYRVAAGDKVLVGRLKEEIGS